MSSGDESTQLQLLLDRYLADETGSFDELIDYANRRLRSLARKMLAKYPHVRRWEETDDVMQAALLRLHNSLCQVRPENKRAFFGLAATQMRRTLIDLARHYYGTYGLGRNYKSVAGADSTSRPERPLDQVGCPSRRMPSDLDRWTAFHAAIDQLPTEEQEVISLVWYGGLMQKEVAEVLGVSNRTVIRRMNRARLALNEIVGDRPPAID